jgi:Flp pilus assembly pilin Flp
VIEASIRVARVREALRRGAAYVLTTLRSEHGQGMVEYALILALVTTVAIAGLTLIPAFPVHVFSEVTNAFP